MQIPRMKSRDVNCLVPGSYYCCAIEGSVKHIVVVEGINATEPPRLLILDANEGGDRFMAASPLYEWRNADFAEFETFVEIDHGSLVCVSEYDAKTGHVILSRGSLWLIGYDEGEGKKKLFNLENGKVEDRKPRSALAAKRWSIFLKEKPGCHPTLLHAFEAKP